MFCRSSATRATKGAYYYAGVQALLAALMDELDSMDAVVDAARLVIEGLEARIQEAIELLSKQAGQ